jgi:hypothetical protein
MFDFSIHAQAMFMFEHYAKEKCNNQCIDRKSKPDAMPVTIAIR